MSEWLWGFLVGGALTAASILFTWLTTNGQPRLTLSHLTPKVDVGEDPESGDDDSPENEPLEFNLQSLQTVSVVKRPSARVLGDGVYFAVLRHCTLFLYNSEEQIDTAGAILVDNVLVELFPAGLFQEELWKKDIPIRLHSTEGAIFAERSQCFLYAANSCEKEDWFVALRHASKFVVGSDARIDRQEMRRYMRGVASSIDRSDGTAAVLNGLIARVFYNARSASIIRDVIECKFKRKARTMWKPSFVGEMQLLGVDTSELKPPTVTNGQLHSLTSLGEFIASADVHFPGTYQMEIGTQVVIEVASATLTVPVQLSVRLKSLSGRAQLRVKPPPSDRLWLGFYEMPTMDIELLPVVQTRQVNSYIVNQIIGRQLKDAVTEYLVLPNMEDLPLPAFILGDLFLTELPYANMQSPPSDMLTHLLAVRSIRAAPIPRSVSESRLHENGHPMPIPEPMKRKRSYQPLRRLLQTPITTGKQFADVRLGDTAAVEPLVSDKTPAEQLSAASQTRITQIHRKSTRMYASLRRSLSETKNRLLMRNGRDAESEDSSVTMDSIPGPQQSPNE